MKHFSFSFKNEKQTPSGSHSAFSVNGKGCLLHKEQIHAILILKEDFDQIYKTQIFGSKRSRFALQMGKLT